MTFLLSLVLAMSAAQSVYDHPCDQWQAWQKGNLYAPLVGEPVTPFFCGPRSADAVPSYTVSVDGVALESPGRLVMAHYEFSDLQRPDAGKNGLVPYVLPGPLVTLASAGPHTIRVVYGTEQIAVAFTYIGVTP